MIATNRLKLRPIQPKDSKAVYQYRSDPEANQFQGWIPKNLQEVEDFIDKNPKEFNQPERWFQLVIIEKSTETLIGDIGVHFVGEENAQCELGCTLNKEFQSKGYATEAMSSVIDHLFKKLGKHRITTSIDTENIRSIELVKRLGFRKEAHFKKNILHNGVWADDLVYALSQSEWEK